ncbi:MAG: hypothetical protein V8S08_11555 [Lachnoclostridium sp.]
MSGGETATEPWEEKINQIRIYSGEKYEMVQEAQAGMVCAVTGLSYTYPGGRSGNRKGVRSSGVGTSVELSDPTAGRL